jgi:hypothetical protein
MVQNSFYNCSCSGAADFHVCRPVCIDSSGHHKPEYIAETLTERPVCPERPEVYRVMCLREPRWLRKSKKDKQLHIALSFSDCTISHSLLFSLTFASSLGSDGATYRFTLAPLHKITVNSQHMSALGQKRTIAEWLHK